MTRMRPLLAGSVLAAVAVAGGLISPAAADEDLGRRSASRTTLAVIGDVPYGAEQEMTVSALVDAVNDDPKVRGAIHVGDIKSGSTTCTDERFANMFALFESFEDPLVYTPGDNEWTDCHRANNGAFNPLERLDTLRSMFFAEPGRTLGEREGRVRAQPSPFIENVRWIDSRVVFATVHVVGSDNGRVPWTGNSAMTPEQEGEVATRTEAAIEWVDDTFNVAENRDLEGVVLAMQADTWFQGGPPGPGHQAIMQRLLERVADFDGEVLVLQGDSHVFVTDNPPGLPEFTRIVVHGETLPYEYLRLTIDPRADELFSWERVAVQA